MLRRLIVVRQSSITGEQGRLYLREHGESRRRCFGMVWSADDARRISILSDEKDLQLTMREGFLFYAYFLRTTCMMREPTVIILMLSNGPGCTGALRTE
jgi:hypothetical protein